MRRRAILGVLALAATTLAACANGGGDPASGIEDSSTPGKDSGASDAKLDALFPGCDPAVDTCAPSQYCSAVTKSCLDGCHLDTGCPATKPHCEVLTHQCVACLKNEDCPSGQACSDHVCVAGCSATRP